MQEKFVTLTRQQMQTADIELGAVGIKNLKTSVRANGMLIMPQNYIFVAADQKQAQADTTLTFERVQVVKGVSDIGYTEVTSVSNLPPDAKVITKGAFFANAKMTNVEEEE